jgi:N4-gp56 family major capsid protein
MILYRATLGGYLTFPTLSDELRRATYPLYEFRQFARAEQTDSKTGEIHYFTRVGRVTTLVSPIGEQEEGTPIPVPPISRGQVRIQDYLAYVEFSEKLERFALFDVQQVIIDTLKQHMAYNIDVLVANALKQTPIKAVPTSNNAVRIVKPGETMPQAGAKALTSAHIKDIVDYMRLELQVPPYDGTNYVCIAHGSAVRTLYDEVTDAFLKYTSPEYFFRSEVAQWYSCRIVQTNNDAALSAAAGTGTTKTPEALFIAYDPLIEVVSVPEEILIETVANTFGRIKRIGWFFSGAWALTWDTVGRGECRVIYVTSG